MEKTDLSREEQWTFLNAPAVITTLGKIQDLQLNRTAYGLSAAQIERTSDELMLLANARLEANGVDSPFRETKAKNRFLRMLDMQEEEVMEKLTKRREYIEAVKAGKATNSGEQLPAGEYMGYNKIDLTNDLNQQMRINAQAFSDYYKSSTAANDMDTLLHFINSVKTGSNGDIKNQDRWRFQKRNDSTGL